VACLILLGIMVFVVPQFEEIFADFDTAMPAPTLFLIWFSNWIVGNVEGQSIPGWAIMFGIPVAIFLANKVLQASKTGRNISDTVKLIPPVFGTLLRYTAIARFTRTLGTLVNAGVPILEAITITRDTVGNYVYESALQKVHDSIREGNSFADPLREAKVCDNLVVNMIDVGEETGDLDKMLMKIADNYDEQVDIAVEAMVSVMEPMMVVFLGGAVGFIVIALFLPLVSIIQSLSS
jgi:type IV pilus assembly protein PilC